MYTRFPALPMSVFQLLFHRFQGFHHRYFFQLAIHYQIHNDGEHHRDCHGIQEGKLFDISSEHHRIQLCQRHNQGVQDDSQHQPCQRTDQCQENILSVYIGTDLLVIKAQYLNGRNLTQSLRYIDIRQIVKYDKCQQSG